MEPVKLYINCHGFELTRPKKLRKTHRMPGNRPKNPSYENMDGDVPATQESVNEPPEVPKRSVPVRKGKSIPILYGLLVVSFLLWAALATLAYFAFTHIVSQQQETSAELKRLKTALQNASMPVAVPTRIVVKEETDLKKVLKALSRCCGYHRLQCMDYFCRMEREWSTELEYVWPGLDNPGEESGPFKTDSSGDVAPPPLDAAYAENTEVSGSTGCIGTGETAIGRGEWSGEAAVVRESWSGEEKGERAERDHTIGGGETDPSRDEEVKPGGHRLGKSSSHAPGGAWIDQTSQQP